jgi:hypothetical protein
VAKGDGNIDKLYEEWRQNPFVQTKTSQFQKTQSLRMSHNKMFETCKTPVTDQMLVNEMMNTQKTYFSCLKEQVPMTPQKPTYSKAYVPMTPQQRSEKLSATQMSGFRGKDNTFTYLARKKQPLGSEVPTSEIVSHMFDKTTECETKAHHISTMERVSSAPSKSRGHNMSSRTAKTSQGALH